MEKTEERGRAWNETIVTKIEYDASVYAETNQIYKKKAAYQRKLQRHFSRNMTIEMLPERA